MGGEWQNARDIDREKLPFYFMIHEAP